MKRFFKIFLSAALSCFCLFGTACTQKSECNTNTADQVSSEQEPQPDHGKCPRRPPRCPEIPKEPNDDREKAVGHEADEPDRQQDARPLPIRRPVNLLPFEIYFEERDGERIVYVVFPSEK